MCPIEQTEAAHLLLGRISNGGRPPTPPSSPSVGWYGVRNAEVCDAGVHIRSWMACTVIAIWRFRTHGVGG